jgi:undecaprenyl pyrophosphate phosphatase UppP
MQGPNPLQWVRYTFGGRLPDRYRDWVLHDTTSRRWLWRFVVRVVVESLPWIVAGFLVLTLFTPLPLGYVLAALGLALVFSLYFTITSAAELTEARLVKHGFPAGTGKQLRHR